MGELYTVLFSRIWQGMSTLYVFDLPITWRQLFIGLLVINISFWILRSVFGFSGITGEVVRQGRNARKENKKLKNQRVKNEKTGFSKDSARLQAHAMKHLK